MIEESDEDEDIEEYHGLNGFYKKVDDFIHGLLTFGGVSYDLN